MTMEQKQKMVAYFVTHSTEQTATEYCVSKQTVLKYAQRYDGTKESLVDRRALTVHRNRYSPSDVEVSALFESLAVENKVGRRKNTLEPTFYRVYMCDSRFAGTRSRAGLRKLANRLIGRCPRKKRKKAKLSVEHKKYGTPKYTGVGQVDKMYIPLSSFSEKMKSKERVEALKDELKQTANENLQLAIRCFYDDALVYLTMARTLDTLCRDAQNDCTAYCKSVDDLPADELLEKRVYQYTFVEIKTRWTFRMMFNTQTELAAYCFMAEVIKRAPFMIKRIHTDNGSEFTNKYLKYHEEHETPFEALLASQDIHYYRIKPGKSWQNGRVECQQRLDKERFYSNIQMDDLDDGQRQLDAYNEQSNHWSKKCLSWISPLDAVAQSMADTI